MCIRDSHVAPSVVAYGVSFFRTAIAAVDTEAVSYTHLDVYKRQGYILYNVYLMCIIDLVD